jgi:prepilin-type N-terminal cleavage/methylation domain-containing protein
MRLNGSRASGDSGERGFTIVEILIALALFSIVSAALFSSIIVVGRAQAAAARIDVAQGGVRAALDLLTRDLEMASAGARGGAITFGSGTPAQANAILVTDSATGADRIDLVLVDPTAQATTLAGFGAGQTTLTVDNTSNFQLGDSIQVGDLSTAVVLTVTGIGASGGTPTLTVAAPINPLPRIYPPGSYVFRSRSVSYYVDATLFGAAGQDPLLMYDPDGANGPIPPQPIAEGIEDLQIALGFDFNGDGQLTSIGAAPGDDEWLYNVAGENAPPTLAQLRSVRVTLVARTTSALTGTLGQRPAAEDRPAAQTADAFPRRVLHSEVAVRNLNL